MPDQRPRRRGPSPTDAMFRCTLGRVALALDPTTEADPAGILATLVTGVSAMLGPGPRVKIGDSDHPLLVWTLLCGRTGSGRKGTAADAARKVLARADPVFWRQNLLSGLSSAEGLITCVADDDEVDSVAVPHDKRKVVLETEFATLLARSRREGNVLPQVLRQAWEGADLRVQTKVPLIATGPHIAITGHISPTEFAARISQSDLAGGSYNRFLTIFVERSKRLPEGDGAPEPLVDKLAYDLHQRLVAARAPRLLVRAEGARARWIEIYDELSELEEDERLDAWTTRAKPYVMRLAALYAVLDARTHIEVHDLEAAMALVQYALASVRFVVDGVSAAADADRVSSWIAEAGSDGLARSHITKRISSKRTAAELEEVLADVLSRPGYASFTPRTNGPGRPSLRYVYADG